jgi:hypothetical protein
MRNLTTALLVLAACGNNGRNAGDDDEAPPDAATAPSPHAPPPHPSVVPHHRTRNPAPGVAPDLGFAKLTFRADGKVIVEDPGEAPEAGTFSVPSPGRLVLTSGSQTVENDFAIAGDQLAFGALIAEGSTTGFVGTWKSSTLSNGVAGSTMLVIDADHTGTQSVTGPSEHVDIPATWSVSGGDLAVSLDYGMTPFTLHYFAVGTTAITNLPFVKE